MKPTRLQTIYQNEEDRRVAGILFRIIFGILATYLVVIGMALYWEDPTLIGITLIGSVALTVPLGLLFKGYLRASNLIFVFIVIATVTIISIQGNGIHDIAVIAYPVIIVFTSLLMQRRDFFLISALILAAMGVLVFGEAYGLFVSRTYETPTAPDFIIVAVILLVSILTVDTLAENVRRNMLLAQKEIASRKKMEAQLRHSNIHDVLTGIYNRAFFDEELALVARSREFPVSIIIGDLDDLKVVNDQRGHAVGDKVLKGAAKLLSGAFRAGDILARIGGDEFAVILPRTDSKTVDMILSRLRISLTKHNAENPDLPILISLGASTAEKGDLKEAFIVADQHMYSDKSARNPGRK